MERFNALGRGAQIMLVGGVLLFISLFLSWQRAEIAGVEVASLSGWDGIGIVLGLVTIVLLAWLIVRLASVDIPLPVSTAMTGALLGTLVLIFAIIKILTILGEETTIWAWIGLGLAVVVAVGSFQVVQEAGGVDQLKSEASSLGSSSSETAAAPPSEPAASAPPPPPPAAPAAPADPAPSAEPAPPAEPAQAPPTTEPVPPSDGEDRPA
jgi:hypothetical protein